MGVCNCSMFCCTFLYVHISIAIILMGKRELIALLNLSSWCLVMVERLFPHGATGLSAVCDCGISWSYSFTIFETIIHLWHGREIKLALNNIRNWNKQHTKYVLQMLPSKLNQNRKWCHSFFSVENCRDSFPWNLWLSMGDFKNNASISLINVYRLSKADLL